MTPARIYLDNAATSWPKPPEVYEAVDHFQREVGAPAGRSTYVEAAEAQQAVDQARLLLARLLGVSQARRIVFTFNGTDALNLAIHGLLQPDDHVVTSIAEHNSVLRPLRALEEEGIITVTRLDCDAAGRIDPDEARRAIAPGTRLLALTHASNVTGAVEPIAEIARIARERDALLLLDAAQTLGHQPVDVEELGADLLAAPGHKGLLGPLGTGLLYIGPRAEPHLRSVRQGGTGTRSDEDIQPETLPDKFEAGNLNMPGIVGLRAAVDYLRLRGVDAIEVHLAELTNQLLAGFGEIEGVRIYGPAAGEERAAIVSIAMPHYDPHEAAAALDGGYRVQVRSGIHCAPRIHERLGTLKSGGTVRFSPGPFSTAEDIDAAIRAVAELATAGAGT